MSGKQMACLCCKVAPRLKETLGFQPRYAYAKHVMACLESGLVMLVTPGADGRARVSWIEPGNSRMKGMKP